ncbi:MAG: mechanosensitive ion channel family protein [bacterium]
MTFLNKTIYDNTLKEWLIALIVFVVSLLILRILKGVIAKRLGILTQKTRTELDDLIAQLIAEIRVFVLLLVAIYAASLVLTVPEKVSSILRNLLIIGFLVQAVIWGNSVIDFFIRRYKKERLEKDAASVTTITALGFVAKLVLWAIMLLIALDNLGIDITGLIAGLGIGGIAIALAVQNILGDLFASLSIVLDKPFVIGDFIILDTYMGTVKQIGLKTTRIQSISGEQLIISNSDLLSSRIRNYKRMYERRVVFSLGVVYQTSYEKLAAIPLFLKEIIEKEEEARFDRAHFKDYGDSSLNYEIVYYVRNPNYNVYMDTQQNINLAIFRRFEQEGIEFAYPTQTLFLQKETANEPEATHSN